MMSRNQVELRVEASVSNGGNATVQLNKLGYHVTILAEIPFPADRWAFP